MTDLPLPYCERLSFGGEPLNTLSNIAYAIVAVWWARAGDLDAGRLTDALLVALIGAFSAVFHAWPTPTTQLLDVAGIAVFVAVALYRLVSHLTPRHSHRILALLGWLVASALASRTPQLLNGSLIYLPTLIALALTCATPSAGHHTALRTAFALFLTALTFRTLDSTLCNVWPYGTHPLWHLLTAVAIAAVLRALAVIDPAPRRSP